MKTKYLIIALVSVLVLSAYVFSQNSKATDKDEISVSILIEWMADEKEIMILDVRNPEELVGKLGHIEGVINIPIHELEKRVAELNNHKEKKVAVICRSGNRSKYGTAILRQNGFKAYNVIGGMRAYNKASGK